MTQHPLFNAAAALAYIAFIVHGINLVGTYFADGPETLIIPMAMLSLFVFSAAFMGYVFLYHPLLLVLAGKPREGGMLFIKTLGIFALCVAFLIGAMLVTLR